jgi:Pyridoxamine 5'-phosphate oxidase
MGALTEELREFLDANRVGVIATLAPDGRPRQCPPTASIMQRIAGSDEPPGPMSYENLAEAGRVILAITVERVTSTNYIGQVKA